MVVFYRFHDQGSKMGIHGLTGFIDNNQHLLHQHELHDCAVVLDGNNFYHFLYYACHVQCSFGGDYDVYRKKIISTLESFKVCGITPFFVMDGAYTVDGRKLKTSLSRASARIRLVDVMANNQRGQALPCLAYETFMQTLNELGIHHATCQFEADNEIAVLANKLQCPVISNDSDFYIFDLNSGFLPLDYMDFTALRKLKPDGTVYHYLHCYRYHVDDFINSFDGLSRSVLPIFASLLGNDFIDSSSFSAFYSRVKVPKIVSKKFSLPPRLSKVISALHWLHTQNDSTEFSHIKDELLGFTKPERRKVVEKMFVSSVNGYVDVENFQGFDLHTFFTIDPEKCHFEAAADFRGHNGRVFPSWFVGAVCRGEITPAILNCAILHRVIILTQVEDLSQGSSFLCSHGLRRVLNGVLLKDDLPGSSQASDFGIGQQKNEKTFKCVLREKLQNRKCVQMNEPELLSDVTRSGKATSKDASDEYKGSVDDLMGEFIEGDCTEADVVEGLKAKSGSMKEICVEEYTRVNKNLLKNFVEPVYCIGHVDVPSLTDLSEMSLDDRRSVLFQSLEVDEALISKFSEDLQLFVGCLVMWSRHASPKLTLGHLKTVIVGVILLRVLLSLMMRKDEVKESDERKDQFRSKDSVLDRGLEHKEKDSDDAVDNDGDDVKEKCSGYLFQGNDCLVMSDGDGMDSAEVGNRSSNLSKGEQETAEKQVQKLNKNRSDSFQRELSINRVCLEADISDLEDIRQNLNKYHTKSPSFNHKTHYDPKISHAFAQLQACMADAINLNKLLRCPVQNIRPADLINGTFLYNFQVELSTRPQPELFIASMLGRDSVFFFIFEQVLGLVIDYVSTDCFMSPTCLSKKSRKRKSKAKEKNRVLDDCMVEKKDSWEVPVSTVPGFDVANLFSVLHVED